MGDTERKALVAVDYLLTRAQTDPDLGYQIGPGTEAFRLLCAAQAAATSVPLEEVERQRGQQHWQGREPRVLELQRRLREVSDA